MNETNPELEGGEKMSQSNRAGPHGSRCSNCQHHSHIMHQGQGQKSEHHIFICTKFKVNVPCSVTSCSGYAISKKRHIYCQRCLKANLATDEGQSINQLKEEVNEQGD